MDKIVWLIISEYKGRYNKDNWSNIQGVYESKDLAREQLEKDFDETEEIVGDVFWNRTEPDSFWFSEDDGTIKEYIEGHPLITE